MTNPEPILPTALPNLSADHVEVCNRIYSLPDFKLTLQTGSYCWRWCYQKCVPVGLGVTLEGDSGHYDLILTKCLQANNVAQDIQWSDYQTSIACILFSAVHEEFICILEQVLDDRCVVTNLNCVQFNDSPGDLIRQQGNDQALGFKLSDHLNHDRIEGVIYMSSTTLAKISLQSKDYPSSSDRRFESLMFNLPLQIDSVRLSHRELKSLVQGSVIKLDNSSLIANKARVSILMGVERLPADITQARGKIKLNATAQIKTGDFKI